MPVGEDTLRYAFGKNWQEYVQKNLDDGVIESSSLHTCEFMKREDFNGLSFIDIGSGSGIHSLGAIRRGASEIHSFDYDPDSVATTRMVRDWAGERVPWKVEQGSVLDEAYMASLPKFDIVYSWGVLHHTGEMWRAIRNAALPLKPGGEFYIALYSAENYTDPSPEEWIRIKRRYNQAGWMTRRLMELNHINVNVIQPHLRSGRTLFQALKYSTARGMNRWTDAKDWLGGYPIEFASVRDTVDFAKSELNLDVVNVVTGEGCTEFLFTDLSLNARWREIEARRTRRRLEGPFQALGGKAWSVPLPDLVHQSDASGFERRSTLMLFEDGKVFGYGHALHKDIHERGAGRYSHWNDHLIFSTSDDSDPNLNGREYSICAEY